MANERTNPPRRMVIPDPLARYFDDDPAIQVPVYPQMCDDDPDLGPVGITLSLVGAVKVEVVVSGDVRGHEA